MFILFVVNSLEYLLTKTSFCKVGEFLFIFKPVFKQKELCESFMSWDVIFNSLLNKCYCNIFLINFWVSLQFLASKIFLLSCCVLGNLPVHVLQLKFWKRWTGQFPSCPSISLFLQVATEHPPPFPNSQKFWYSTLRIVMLSSSVILCSIRLISFTCLSVKPNLFLK